MEMLNAAVIVWLGLLFIYTTPTAAIVGDDTFDNCEFLGNRRLQVSWTLRSNDSEIDFQLCGCSSGGDVGANEYMGFGLSGSETRTLMVGADATIAYVDDSTGAVAVDYFLSDYVQCGVGNGACPDVMDSRSCPDNVRNVAGFRREGFQCVSFTRSLASVDTTCDIAFAPDTPQYIVWAVGSVGDTAFKHFNRADSTDAPITFGREPANSCPGGLICPNCPAFQETIMDATGRDEAFVANIGPPGNERGYLAIAGQAGWGIAWYINGTLIPRIKVERGYTYTFLSEGGQPGEVNNYHPFYITDDRVGGYLRKTEAQRRAEVIYAGFDSEGNPTGVGPYCEIYQTPAAGDILNTCGPQDKYMENLAKRPCTSEGSPGYFTWTPDDTTPNTVYYQCATHRNLGYKITVTGGQPPLVAYTTTIVLLAVLTFAL